MGPFVKNEDKMPLCNHEPWHLWCLPDTVGSGGVGQRGPRREELGAGVQQPEEMERWLGLKGWPGGSQEQAVPASDLKGAACTT